MSRIAPIFRTLRLENDFYFKMALRQACDESRRSLDEQISHRQALADRISSCRTNAGTIWVCQSGRDCDGVEYLHAPYRIVGTLQAYQQEYNRCNRWADGPFMLHILTPDEAADLQVESRDLSLEAFEDGHPYSIHH